MGTMKFSIPDDVKQAFDEAFKDVNKNEIMTRLIREAVAESMWQPKEACGIVDQMQKLRDQGPAFTADEMRRAREEGRP